MIPQPDGDNGRYIRDAFRHQETSCSGIYKEDMDYIMSDLIDVSSPVLFYKADAVPPYKEEDLSPRFRVIVGWNDDGKHLGIAVRSGVEIEIVHYARVPSVLNRIIKIQNKRDKHVFGKDY